MTIYYSLYAKNQLQNIKDYISKENKSRAIEHLKKIKNKIEILGKFPYLGKENSVQNDAKIRDFVALGYKIIYKINDKSIVILGIYKYIDIDEGFFDAES